MKIKYPTTQPYDDIPFLKNLIFIFEGVSISHKIHKNIVKPKIFITNSIA